MTISRIISHFERSERGAAVLEFVIVMPFTFVLFALLLDFGRIYWGYQASVAGIRDASRYLARVAPVDICVSGGTLDNFEAALLTMVRNESGASVLPGGLTVTSVDADYTCVSGTFRTSPAAVATVTAQLNVQFLLSGWFDVAANPLAGFTTSIADQTKVYGQ